MPVLNDKNGYLAGSFSKAVKVIDGNLAFTNGTTSYNVTSECLKGLEGKTVLINAAMEIQRGESQIGKATPVK